jgi:hypothetical protein
LVKLLKKGSMVVVREVNMKVAQMIPRKGGNILADTRELALKVEQGATRNQPCAGKLLSHPPHKPKYRPHYQTEGLKGHTFYRIAGFLAPATITVSQQEAASVADKLSAIVWDTAGNADPIGITDIINRYFGLDFDER